MNAHTQQAHRALRQYMNELSPMALVQNITKPIEVRAFIMLPREGCLR